MQQYLSLLSKIIDDGEYRMDRTGTGTTSIFGAQLRFNLQDGFPLLTTKKVFMKGVIHELLWFLSGDTNTKYLVDNGVYIWDEWATETGELGPVYGYQWRKWGARDREGFYVVHDQIKMLIHGIKSKPYSRRHIVSTWNVPSLPNESISPQDNVKNGVMALAPCHVMFQFYVHTNGKLSCHLYQRSVDCFLGLPFNIASYALLTHMVAQQCDLDVGDLVMSFGDAHIYNNHLTEDIVFLQLARTPRQLPKLQIKTKPNSIFGYKYNDFELIGYDPAPAISAPISV